jgi:hypothetical protein
VAVSVITHWDGSAIASFTSVLRRGSPSVTRFDPSASSGQCGNLMAMTRFKLPAALALTLLALPAAAEAKTKDLWATVNVCDTAKSPDMMGVRARMPGNGRRQRMYMRFTAQYRTGGAWKVVPGRGRSPWLYAGSALFRNQERGYTFKFDEPAAGVSYTMRGLVQYEWRAKRGKRGHMRTVVVRKATRYTTRGHRSVGAQPPRYSAARCKIRGPEAPAG